MGYMYPRDPMEIYIGYLYPMEIPMGYLCLMEISMYSYTMEIFMGYMYPNGFPCHMKTNLCETMPRLFAIVGCAPLGLNNQPLVLKAHSWTS